MVSPALTPPPVLPNSSLSSLAKVLYFNIGYKHVDREPAVQRDDCSLHLKGWVVQWSHQNVDMIIWRPCRALVVALPVPARRVVGLYDVCYG
jgi:hypothetical protein